MCFAVNDGPGIRTTVFFKGCPLRCAWCHNPESISPKPELFLRPERCIGCGACVTTCEQQAITLANGNAFTQRQKCKQCGACVLVCPAEARAIVGQKRCVEEVMNEVEKDLIFYQQSGGGITLSGGEPLAQPSFATALLSACKQRGIHTAIDTSGYAPSSKLRRLHPFVDLYLYDLKTLDEDDHKKYTGVPLQPILDNLHWLCRQKAKIIIRIPLLPGINDDPQQIETMGRFIDQLKAVDSVQLLPYHRIGVGKYQRLSKRYKLTDMSSPSLEHQQKIASIFQKYIQTVTLG